MFANWPEVPPFKWMCIIFIVLIILTVAGQCTSEVVKTRRVADPSARFHVVEVKHRGWTPVTLYVVTDGDTGAEYLAVEGCGMAPLDTSRQKEE